MGFFLQTRIYTYLIPVHIHKHNDQIPAFKNRVDPGILIALIWPNNKKSPVALSSSQK